jgi:hypothetical protein
MLCVRDEEKKHDAFVCVLQANFFQQVMYQ